MCGIVGVLNLAESQFQVTDQYLTPMRDAMAHRGPDGAGLWISEDRRIGMGHRRLAIIDLAPQADQPMHDSSGQLTIVYNGEIYNHAELREQLKALGNHEWKTDHSDTEVVLAAFRQWGIDCVHRFRGMFAFALWDARSRQLWLVRDRIGIKPLYYSQHHGRLTFASEIKGLLADPEQGKDVDEEALYHYLTFLTTPAPSTMFQGISKLPHGHWLMATEDGRTEVHRYWDVWDHTRPLTNTSESDIADMVLEELRTSVQLRKVGDVPVGVFLSGGIDSTTNAALFSDRRAAEVKSFCIGYSGEFSDYTNETDHARMAAQTAGTTHFEQLLSLDDLLGFLPQMVHLQDEPLADSVCMPLYFVSKLASEQGLKVCQVGEGADELFIGYPGWKKQLDLQRQVDSYMKVGTHPALSGLLKLWPWQYGSRYEYLRRAAAHQPMFWGGAGAFTETEKSKLFGRSGQKRFSHVSSFEVVSKIRKRFEESAWEPSHVNWMTYMDLSLRLPELLLMRVDKMSMGTSLEARVPFLDHEFVTLALSIPSETRFRDGVHKHILKRAVGGVIPKEIIDRPKQGFGVPLADWLLQRLGNETYDVVKRFCNQSGLLDWKESQRVFARHDTARIWTLWNVASWWEKHFS